MVTLERRIERLESDVHNLKHSDDELRVDIQESEDRQMAALADLKSEMNLRMDRLDGLLHIVIRVLYITMGKDADLQSAFKEVIESVPGGADILDA